MTQLERLKEAGPYRRWNVIPNITTLASYSFLTQTIELFECDSSQFAAALVSETIGKRKITILLAHEFRHWLDHIGTLWGQKMLVSSYDAHHARIRGSEADLWRVIAYYRSLRDSRFERYYTTRDIEDPPDGNRKWKYQFSAGARYDHTGRIDPTHPIAFTRFSWLDGSVACRVPFSVAALLEASAMYYEMRTEESFVPFLPAGSRQDAHIANQRKMLDATYQIDLAEYSVAVHAVANILELFDCPTAFHAVSILSALSLNIPDQLFDRINHPPQFSSWGDSRHHFLARRDRGYAFLALVRSAPPFDGRDVVGWIEETLKAAGMPNLGEVKQLARLEMQEIARSLSHGEFYIHAQSQLELGLDFFDKFGPLYEYEKVLPTLAKVPLPPIVLSDLTIVGNGSIVGWDESPFGEWLNQMCYLQAEEDESVDACGL
jgi:hypothetical protein